MKKRITKIAIYSFIISFISLSLIMKREITTVDFNGLTSLYKMSYTELFLDVFQYSLVIVLIVIIISLITNWVKSKTTEKNII
jgi:hypothetical protein